MSPLAHLHIFPSQLIWSNTPGPLLRGCTYCLCNPLADRSFPEFAQLSFSIRLHLHLCPSLFALAPLNCYQCALSRSCYQGALLWVGFSRECGGKFASRGFCGFEIFTTFRVRLRPGIETQGVHVSPREPGAPWGSVRTAHPARMKRPICFRNFLALLPSHAQVYV